jgi:hypothetical protein
LILRFAWQSTAPPVGWFATCLCLLRQTMRRFYTVRKLLFLE